MADEPDGVRAASVHRLNNRYRLVERVAVGGMAEVWHAVDEYLQRPVAVKVLKPVMAANPVALERFRREAVAGARFSHPNLVGVYDTVSERGVEAIVMELVPGESLRQRLDRLGRLDVATTIAVAQQVLSGLTVAHRHGVIHRDIKPANILMSTDGRVLLGDFGIAKADETPVLDLTSDDVMIGTVKYLAPEQVTGEALDARSDLYSLGVVLYECLAGRPPFLAENEAATALARLHQPAPGAAESRPDAPVQLAGLIDACLAREPAHRPASASEALTLLAGSTGPAASTALAGSTAATDTTTVRLIDITRSHATPGNTVSGSSNRPSGARSAAAAHNTTTGTLLTAKRSASRTRRERRSSKAMTTQRTTHRVVRLLLIAAVLVSLVTAASTDAGFGWLSRDNSPDEPVATVATTVLPVRSIVAWDPFGDGSERDASAGAAVDGNADTAWSTERYRARDMAGKPGVGLVVELTRANGDITVQMATDGSDWSAHLYRSETRGATVSAWGTPAADIAHADGTAQAKVGGTGRFLLLWIVDPGTSAPRYHLAIRELLVHG